VTFDDMSSDAANSAVDNDFILGSPVHSSLSDKGIFPDARLLSWIKYVKDSAVGLLADY
jgi:hypothetical protein